MHQNKNTCSCRWNISKLTGVKSGDLGNDLLTKGTEYLMIA